MIFRIVDFPEPLAPRMIFVWPDLSVEADVLQDDLVVECQLHVVERDDRFVGFARVARSAGVWLPYSVGCGCRLALPC